MLTPCTIFSIAPQLRIFPGRCLIQPRSPCTTTKDFHPVLPHWAKLCRPCGALETFAQAYFDTPRKKGAALTGALEVLRGSARRDLHGFHLLDVLGVRRFRTAQGGLRRQPVLHREVAKDIVLARQEIGHAPRRQDGPVWNDLAREWRDHLVGSINSAVLE